MGGPERPETLVRDGPGRENSIAVRPGRRLDLS